MKLLPWHFRPISSSPNKDCNQFQSLSLQRRRFFYIFSFRNYSFLRQQFSVRFPHFAPISFRSSFSSSCAGVSSRRPLLRSITGPSASVQHSYHSYAAAESGTSGNGWCLLETDAQPWSEEVFNPEIMVRVAFEASTTFHSSNLSIGHSSQITHGAAEQVEEVSFSYGFYWRV